MVEECGDSVLTMESCPLQFQCPAIVDPILPTEVVECTVDVARNNFRCPTPGCLVDPVMERACEGSIITVDEVNEDSSECCLKFCNFRCDSDPEDALQAGETCCDWEGNMSLVACERTCASGLTCLYDENTGATCTRNEIEPEELTCADDGMCCPVGYTCMRPRGSRPGQMECVGFGDELAPAMPCEEPCLMVDCLPGCDKVGSDELAPAMPCEEPCLMVDCLP